MTPVKSITPMFVSTRLQETRDFYQRHFDLTPSFDCGWYVALRARAEGPVHFEISFREPKPGDAPAVAGITLALQVPNADEACARLAAAGVPVLKPLCDNPWGDRSFIVQDPNGIGLYVFHPIAPSREFLPFIKL